MNRRAALRTMGIGIVAATAGCVANGRVAVDESTSIRVEPTKGWWLELPDVKGDGALSYTVRANQQFDVYYFQSEQSLTHYKNYLYKGDDSTMPDGHEDFSQAAIPDGDSGKFEVEVPEDGGRKSIDTEGSHYFVVDHSNYGRGVRVESSQDQLDAFVDLKLYENTSII
jgi:hypothetical protein